MNVILFFISFISAEKFVFEATNYPTHFQQKGTSLDSFLVNSNLNRTIYSIYQLFPKNSVYIFTDGDHNEPIKYSEYTVIQFSRNSKSSLYIPPSSSTIITSRVIDIGVIALGDTCMDEDSLYVGNSNSGVEKNSQSILDGKKGCWFLSSYKSTPKINTSRNLLSSDVLIYRSYNSENVTVPISADGNPSKTVFNRDQTEDDQPMMVYFEAGQSGSSNKYNYHTLKFQLDFPKNYIGPGPDYRKYLTVVPKVKLPIPEDSPKSDNNKKQMTLIIAIVVPIVVVVIIVIIVIVVIINKKRKNKNCSSSSSSSSSSKLVEYNGDWIPKNQLDKMKV